MRLAVIVTSVLSCTVSEILQVFCAPDPTPIHRNFGVFSLHQIARVGVSPSTSLKLFGREIIFEVFQPMWSRYLNVTDRRTDGHVGQTDNILSHNRGSRRKNGGLSMRKRLHMQEGVRRRYCSLSVWYADCVCSKNCSWDGPVKQSTGRRHHGIVMARFVTSDFSVRRVYYTQLSSHIHCRLRLQSR